MYVSDGNADAGVDVGTAMLVAEETVSIAVTVPALDVLVVSIALDGEVSCVGVSGSLFSVK